MAVKIVDKRGDKYRQLRKKLDADMETNIEQAENSKNEVVAMTKLHKHPNVVKLKEVIDDPSDEKVLLVMEYIDGGSLMTLDQEGIP